ncbi:MAG: hypothetical protein HFACDABA_02044 [Anaerolineales bacterium]|nr:hypothetical protein [Anaerolineales bacterium]
MDTQDNLNERSADEQQAETVVRLQYKTPVLEAHGDFDALTQGWTSGKYNDPYPGGKGSLYITKV